MRHPALVDKARQLESQGWSLKAIARELGTKPATISRWCGDILPDKRLEGIRNYFYKLRLKYFELDRLPKVKLSVCQAKLLVALLYWCEGAKYPSSNRVVFTNSDSDLLRIFIFMLRKAFPVDESKFSIWLQIHSDQNKTEIIKFWSKLLDIPAKCFIKPHVTDKRGGKYRRIYMGTCSIRYSDYTLLLRLMGVYQRFVSSVMKLN